MIYLYVKTREKLKFICTSFYAWSSSSFATEFNFSREKMSSRPVETFNVKHNKPDVYDFFFLIFSVQHNIIECKIQIISQVFTLRGEMIKQRSRTLGRVRRGNVGMQITSLCRNETKTTPGRCLFRVRG